MKIGIVNTFDISGGAAKAAYRLHKALIGEGQESFMDRFGSLQNRDYVRHYIELLKLIVPTPKELHVYDEKEEPEFKVVVVNARDEIERLEGLEKDAS